MRDETGDRHSERELPDQFPSREVPESENAIRAQGAEHAAGRVDTNAPNGAPVGPQTLLCLEAPPVLARLDVEELHVSAGVPHSHKVPAGTGAYAGRPGIGAVRRLDAVLSDRPSEEVPGLHPRETRVHGCYAVPLVRARHFHREVGDGRESHALHTDTSLAALSEGVPLGELETGGSDQGEEAEGPVPRGGQEGQAAGGEEPNAGGRGGVAGPGPKQSGETSRLIEHPHLQSTLITQLTEIVHTYLYGVVVASRDSYLVCPHERERGDRSQMSVAYDSIQSLLLQIPHGDLSPGAAGNKDRFSVQPETETSDGRVLREAKH